MRVASSDAFGFAAALIAVALCGCGSSDPAFRSYEDARRAPSHHEVGPHGGHLIELSGGTNYAELTYDPATRRLALYVLADDFLTPQPVSQGDVTLQFVEKRPFAVTLPGSPLAHDPQGESSRFEATGVKMPASIASIEDLEGQVTLRVGGKEVQGTLHHDHGHGSGPRGHGGRAQHAAVPFTGRMLLLLTVYCILIVGSSLAGGWLPSLIDLTHNRMQILISLVGGLMLGIGLFHMLPHAIAETGSVDSGVRWTVAGLLTMFFLIRTFHFHQHGVAEVPKEGAPGPLRVVDGPHAHDHDCGHDHDHDHGQGHQHEAGHAHHGHGHHGHSHAHGHGTPHSLSWLGVAVGLSLHTLIDGMALGASMQADAGHGATGGLFGLATFFAILLHKPLDAVSITSLMKAAGWPPLWRHAVNAGFAMMCPLGAGLFFLGVQQFSAQQSWIVGSALAFSAGVFLCISLGDLLPEVEFHSHDRVKLSLALLAGIALAWLLGYLEPEHAHSHGGIEKRVPRRESSIVHQSNLEYHACESALHCRTMQRCRS